LTCNICSRTCTHLPPPQPPTPMLSYSPTPPCTPLPPLPLRLAVTFQSVTSAVVLKSPRVTSRQRKRREFDGGSNPSDNHHMMEDFVDESADDEMIIDGSGCSRKVCRNCSFENPQRYAPQTFQVNSSTNPCVCAANLQPATIATDARCDLPFTPPILSLRYPPGFTPARVRDTSHTPTCCIHKLPPCHMIRLTNHHAFRSIRPETSPDEIGQCANRPEIQKVARPG
jgi:hypothetical protein